MNHQRIVLYDVTKCYGSIYHHSDVFCANWNVLPSPRRRLHPSLDLLQLIHEEENIMVWLYIHLWMYWMKYCCSGIVVLHLCIMILLLYFTHVFSSTEKTPKNLHVNTHLATVILLEGSCYKLNRSYFYNSLLRVNNDYITPKVIQGAYVLSRGICHLALYILWNIQLVIL